MEYCNYCHTDNTVICGFCCASDCQGCVSMCAAVRCTALRERHGWAIRGCLLQLCSLTFDRWLQKFLRSELQPLLLVHIVMWLLRLIEGNVDRAGVWGERSTVPLLCNEWGRKLDCETAALSCESSGECWFLQGMGKKIMFQIVLIRYINYNSEKYRSERLHPC